MVVTDLHPVVERYHVAMSIDAGHASVPDADVFGASEDRANGVGHVSRLEAGGCHLVEQWQERVKVMTINQRDANRLIGQTLHGRHASESSAYHDDMGP